MRGVFAHPKTGILWVRKVTPTDIKRQKARLMELGLPYVGELQRSLGTRDIRRAAQPYAEHTVQIDAIFESWRKALRDGPVDLTFPQAQSLAAGRAKEFLRRHGDDPLTALSQINRVSPLPLSPEAKRAIAPRSQAEADELREELRIIDRGAEAERQSLIRRWQSGAGYLSRFPEVMRIFSEGFEQLSGHESDAALREHGLAVTPAARLNLNYAVAGHMGRAKEALRGIVEGDHTGADAIKSLPSFKQALTPREFSLTQFIDEEVAWRASGRDAKPMPANTEEKYRRAAEEFSAYRKSDAAHTINDEEMFGWVRNLQKIGTEPHRVCRRLQLLSKVEHDEQNDEQVFS